MNLIKSTPSYRRAYKKLYKSGKTKAVKELMRVIDLLAAGQALCSKYQDHKLTGRLSNFRECHVQPDLLLVYYVDGFASVLVLVDLGTHSELFG